MATAPTEIAAEIIDNDLPDEMRDSFMPYALSVTTSRAIPDARDGLKPVQRRILYVMHELGLQPAGGHRKSAGIVGEVMGKYHPHGDSAIYEAMVRMGQPTATNVPFVGTRGNFGGLDDPPAAYRYTEARLSPAAVAMLDGIGEDAVPFDDTFDGEREEPAVLPAGLPNLLVNGASGIAVGMATSIPPHNLGEVVAAVKKWLKSSGQKPLTSRDFLSSIPGPDFPCGGILIADKQEILEAYTSGRGSFTLRSRCTVEPVTAKRVQLVFTELPYTIGAERVIERVRDAKEKGRLPGVAEVNNTSDKSGAKVTIDLQPDANVEMAKSALYSYTPLEDSVSVNMVALLDGQPLQMSLYQMIAAYGEHLLETGRRRAEFVRERAQQRAHILRGLIAATAAIEEVIRTIRKAKDAEAARNGLKKLLDIDDEQAEAILNMRLRRLSALEEIALRNDLKEQEGIIADRTAVLEDPKLMRAECVQRLDRLANPLTTARRTVILADVKEDVPVSARPPIIVTFNQNKSLSVASKRSKKAGATTQITADTGTALGVRSNGAVVTITADENPKGRNFAGVLSGTCPALIVTSKGRVCRVSPDLALASGSVPSLHTEEEIAAVCDAPDDAELFFVSSDGKCLRTAASNYIVGGKVRFVDSFKLADDAHLVMVQPADDKSQLLTLHDDGTAKCTSVADIPVKGRVGGGVLVLPSGSPLKVTAAVVSHSPTAVRNRARNSSIVPTTPRARKPAGDFKSISAM